MTQFKALVETLHLALIAPDDARAAKAASLAESIAEGLTIAHVEMAQRLALALATGAA
jgi:hypothetical protein